MPYMLRSLSNVTSNPYYHSSIDIILAQSSPNSGVLTTFQVETTGQLVSFYKKRGLTSLIKKYRVQKRKLDESAAEQPNFTKRQRVETQTENDVDLQSPNELEYHDGNSGWPCGPDMEPILSPQDVTENRCPLSGDLEMSICSPEILLSNNGMS